MSPSFELILSIFSQAKHPSALDNFDKMMSKAKGKNIVVFLDYDGTLSPIVEDPDQAFMTDAVITLLLLKTTYIYIYIHWRSFHHIKLLFGNIIFETADAISST